MAEAYYEVRFRWFRAADLNKLEEKFKSYGFTVGWHKLPKSGLVFSDENLEELEVKADTLIAHLSRFRALITQRDPATLTDRDLQLRKIIREDYSRSRSFVTP